MNLNNNENNNEHSQAPCVIAACSLMSKEYTYKHRPRDETTIWRYEEGGKYNPRPKDTDYPKQFTHLN